MWARSSGRRGSRVVEPLVGAVFRALRAQLPPRANAIVEGQLPQELVAFWRGGSRH